MSEGRGRTGVQQEAEAEVERFQDQLGPFVAAAKATRMPMVFTNAREPGHPIIFANESFLRLAGYGREEVLGRSFNFLMAQGGGQEALARVEAAFRGEEDGQAEIEYRRKDGSTLWVGLFISSVADASGQIVQHFASFHDLTRHHDAQAQSRMLIDELNHRVKNTLATVQSIVSQALRKNSDVTAAREAIESRLVALSQSHNLLTRGSWNSTGLRDVVMNALEPFGVTDGRAERFTVEGADLRMPPKAVLALSIALHELATNAVKYGAFSNDAGRVLIEWTVEPAPEGRRVVLHWREINGPPVVPPTRTGFGSQMIERGLAHELEADVSLDYRADGLICTISIRLP
jgi:PAS domain S-box-containing protein